MKEILIAVDPGKSGALCSEIDGTIESYKCPATQKEVVTLVKELKATAEANETPIRAIVEKVHAMPKQGVTSVWSFSANYNTWLVALLACEIPFKLVRPQEWQKVVGGLPKDKKQRKNALKAYSQQLYPQQKVTLANADALAMLSIFHKVW